MFVCTTPALTTPSLFLSRYRDFQSHQSERASEEDLDQGAVVDDSFENIVPPPGMNEIVDDDTFAYGGYISSIQVAKF